MVFIDCVNSFPAYELVEKTVDTFPNIIDPHVVIRNIQLSRSFNYHQVNQIATKYLRKLLKDGITINENIDSHVKKKKTKTPRLIIISGLPDIFLNEETAKYMQYDDRPSWYPILELNHTLGELKALALEYNCVILVTASMAPKSKTKVLGGTYFQHSAGVIIHLHQIWNELVADLVQHPFLSPNRTRLRLLKRKNKKKAIIPLSYFLN